MAQRIPALLVGGINIISLLIKHECLISQADIISDFEITRGQSIRFDSMNPECVFDFNDHFLPKIFGMLIGNGDLVIPCEGAPIKLFSVFDNIDGYLPSELGVDGLTKIDDLHAGSAFHFDENGHNQVPGLLDIFMLNRHMEFPIGNPMLKLVLGMPVDPGLEGVQFDEPVIAQALIYLVLGNLVAMCFVELIREHFRECQLLLGAGFLLLLLHIRIISYKISIIIESNSLQFRQSFKMTQQIHLHFLLSILTTIWVTSCNMQSGIGLIGEMCEG